MRRLRVSLSQPEVHDGMLSRVVGGGMDYRKQIEAEECQRKRVLRLFVLSRPPMR
jgi:hypothetical protein